MNKYLKISLYSLGILALVAVLTVLGVNFGEYDLALSRAIGDPDSLYGQFFAYFGDGIAYMILLFGLLVILCNIPKEKRYLGLLNVALIFVTLFMTNKWFVKHVMTEGISASEYKYLYVVFLAAVETFFFVKISTYFDKLLMNKWLLFGVFCVLVVLTSQAIVQGSKLFWCRLRFRNMDDAATGFTPWWHPNWTKSAIADYVVEGSPQPDDFYKSFPSGHTASAGVLFVLIYLPLIYKDAPNWKKVLCYLVPWIAVIVMAFSRVVNEAHFLSDTVIGGAAAFFSAVLWKYALPEIAKKISKKRGSDTAKEIVR